MDYKFDRKPTDTDEDNDIPLGTPWEVDYADGKGVRKFVRFQNQCYADDGTTETRIKKGEVILQCTMAADANAMFTGTNNISTAGMAIIGAGVCVAGIAFGYYGWAQVGGYCDFLRTDAGVALGDPLVAGTNAADGEVDTMGDGEEEQVIGWALKEDVATEYDDESTPATQDTCEAMLSNCLWGR